MVDIEKAPLLSPRSAAEGAGTAPCISDDPAPRERTEADKRHTSAAWRSTTRRRGRGAFTAVCAVIILAVVVVGLVTVLGHAVGSSRGGDKPAFSAPRRIPLEAHIMSKCPDARDCLRDLVVPAMQQVEGYVDFKLSFIGDAAEDGGVQCKHGPQECLGNILELCGEALYRDPKVWLGFAMCMSDQYEDIPSEGLVRECALEHGISFEALNDCASDDNVGRGMDLLRSSVERSGSSNVTKSCTVRVDEELWCILDGGEWKDCPGGSGVSDLVGEIERLRKENA